MKRRTLTASSQNPVTKGVFNFRQTQQLKAIAKHRYARPPATIDLCPYKERIPSRFYKLSEYLYERLSAQFRRSPAQLIRSPARCKRSPARLIRSPARLIRSPARLIRSPARSIRSPNAPIRSPYSPKRRPRAPIRAAIFRLRRAKKGVLCPKTDNLTLNILFNPHDSHSEKENLYERLRQTPPRDADPCRQIWR